MLVRYRDDLCSGDAVMGTPAPGITQTPKQPQNACRYRQEKEDSQDQRWKRDLAGVLSNQSQVGHIHTGSLAAQDHEEEGIEKEKTK